MSVLKRFSNSLDNRYFRQQQPGVMTNSVGFNDFLTASPNVWNPSPIHTSQLVVDASFLMDKRLVDEAAWTQNRAIAPQEVPDSDRWMCGICDKPPMPESAPWTDA